MPSTKTVLAVAVPLLVVVGGASYHRIKRNRYLSQEAAVKAEGLVTVTLVTVESRAFQDAVPFTGTLLAVNRAELKAEVPGRVTRVTVFEGDRVAQGTVLATQDEEDLLLGVTAAEAQLAQAQAQAAQAKRDHERMQMLLEKRSVTKQAAQQAETYFNASMAGARAAESNLGLAKSRLHKAQIRAPFAGQVAQRLIQPGEMLNPGQPALSVVDNRTLEILADLPAEAGALVKTGMKALFRLSGANGEEIAGRVTQVAPSLLADGRTLRVRIEVANPQGTLRSGFFAEGQILSESKSPKPALPQGVLTAMGREADIYVSENGVARKKRIQLGAEQDGWRAITGLTPGTQVVAQGRDLVVEGTRLQVAPAGKVN